MLYKRASQFWKCQEEGTCGGLPNNTAPTLTSHRYISPYACGSAIHVVAARYGAAEVGIRRRREPFGFAWRRVSLTTAHVQRGRDTKPGLVRHVQHS